MKKIIILLSFIFSLCIGAMPISFASINVIDAVGQYTMGPKDTLQEAEEGALAEALRYASEQAGLYIESQTITKDMKLSSDFISVATGHHMKITSKKYERELTQSGDIHVKVYITVEVDYEATIQELKSDSKQTAVTPTSGYYTSGQTMTISFPYGMRSGTYIGELNSNNLPHGKGTFNSQNPQGMPWSYEGEFVNGIFDGQGKTIWTSANQYEEGVYHNGQLNGLGKKFTNGILYEGNFEFGEPMLKAVNVQQSVQYGVAEYHITDIQICNNIMTAIPNGKFLIVFMSFKNNGNVPVQVSTKGYTLFNKNTGSKYNGDTNAMLALKNAQIHKHIYNSPWHLSVVEPGIELKSIPIVFDVPVNANPSDFKFIPADGFGKVVPILLQ